MELVYLWVEDYKNIQKQGFNFSPNFECKFDPDYEIYYENGDTKEEYPFKRLSNNCKLEIVDKKEEDNDYLKSFFGEYINLNAVIGENGSGKSSLIKVVLMLLYYQEVKFLDRSDKFLSHQYQRNYHNKKRLERDYFKKNFLIIKQNEQFKYIGISEQSIFKDIESVKTLDFYSVYINYMADSLFDDRDDKWINELYYKDDTIYSLPKRFTMPIERDINYQVSLFPNKYNIEDEFDMKESKGRINLDEEIQQLNEKILYVFSDTDKLTSFFNPNYVSMSIERRIGRNLLDRLSSRMNYIIIQRNWKVNNKDKNLDEKVSNIRDDLEYVNLLYLAYEILFFNIKEFEPKLFKEFENTVKDFVENGELPSKDFLINFDYEELFSKNDNLHMNKITKCLNFHRKEYFKVEILKQLIRGLKFVKISEIESYIQNIPFWIQLTFFDDKKSFSSLSSGEKIIFKTLVDILYLFKNNSNNQTVNFFLDEVELGLHPNSQKSYLKMIINSLSNIVKKNKKINLILITHSPFLISDIPKRNIIFLGKYTEKCNEVINGKQKVNNSKNITDKIEINPFGANIHTLLSHGFFMKDGLMGEFAKDKIQSIIKYHEDIEKKEILEAEKIEYKTKKQKKFWQIQSIIGDDYLKQVIKNHLIEIEKIVLGNDEAKKEEVKRLKAQIELLEK